MAAAFGISDLCFLFRKGRKQLRWKRGACDSYNCSGNTVCIGHSISQRHAVGQTGKNGSDMGISCANGIFYLRTGTEGTRYPSFPGSRQ